MLERRECCYCNNEPTSASLISNLVLIFTHFRQLYKLFKTTNDLLASKMENSKKSHYDVNYLTLNMSSIVGNHKRDRN